MDGNLDTSFMQFDVNWVPRSLRTSSGTPTRLDMSINAFATVSVSMFFSGIASEYLSHSPVTSGCTCALCR